MATLLHDSETARSPRGARDAYAERLRALRGALHERGIQPQPTRDGLNAWIPLQRRENHLTEELAARGWAVRHCSDLAATGRDAEALRMTTSTITPQQAKAFAADLATALNSTRGT